MENMWQHPKRPMFAFWELTCCLPSMITHISLSKYPYTSVYHDRQHPESAKMLGVHSDSGTQSTLLQEIGVQHSWLQRRHWNMWRLHNHSSTHVRYVYKACALLFRRYLIYFKTIAIIVTAWPIIMEGGERMILQNRIYIYIYKYIMVQRHPFGFWDRWSLVAPAASLDFCIRFIRLLHPLGRITTWIMSNAAIWQWQCMVTISMLGRKWNGNDRLVENVSPRCISSCCTTSSHNTHQQCCLSEVFYSPPRQPCQLGKCVRSAL